MSENSKVSITQKEVKNLGVLVTISNGSLSSCLLVKDKILNEDKGILSKIFNCCLLELNSFNLDESKDTELIDNLSKVSHSIVHEKLDLNKEQCEYTLNKEIPLVEITYCILKQLIIMKTKDLSIEDEIFNYRNFKFLSKETKIRERLNKYQDLHSIIKEVVDFYILNGQRPYSFISATSIIISNLDSKVYNKVMSIKNFNLFYFISNIYKQLCYGSYYIKVELIEG